MSSKSGEYAVIHARKRFIEGHAHLNGEMAVFNAHQTTILDDARRFSKLAGADGIPNYRVVAIVMMGYSRPDPNVWTDSPTHEVARWELGD